MEIFVSGVRLVTAKGGVRPNLNVCCRPGLPVAMALAMVLCLLQPSAFCQSSGVPISWFGQCLKLDPVSCCDWVSEYQTLPGPISCGQWSCMPLVNSMSTNRWRVGAPGYRALITLPNKSCTVWSPVCIEMPTGSVQCALEPDPVIYVCSDCAVPALATPCAK